MNKKQLLIRSGNAALAAVLGLSPVTSMIQPLVVQAETVSAGTVTVDNNGNNNIAWLDQLGTAKYFTFSADVTFNDFEEGQQSAALAFGDYRANVHGKIDWAQPVRLWGDGKGVDVRVPGDTGQANTWLADNSISLASTFRLTVSVTEDNVARYSVNGVPAIETPLAADYQGGSFGLMTYSSSATFSNITLDVIPEPDRMALDALLEECAQLQEDDYTPETWAALQTAIAQAKAAASQEEIDAALTAVQEAKAALEKRPEPGEGETDKRELNKLIKQAAALRENDYTAETWTAFSEALTAAQSVAADEKAEQTAVDEALAALQTAMEALEKRTAQEQAPENFNNVGGANAEVVDGTLVLDALGDHFAMLESQKTAANDFHYEADVKLLEGQDGEPDMSAALVFGAASRKTPGSKWYAANMDTRRRNNSDYFRVFGAGQDILGGGNTSDVDPEKPIHLAIDVKSDGSFTYEFGNVGETMHSVSGTIPAWQGGYVGLLTFRAKAAFSNIQFLDRTVSVPDEKLEITDDSKWDTNLEESTIKGGTWTTTDEGLVSDATNKGDTFLISGVNGKNFIYETDMTYASNSGAAGLLFRFSETEDGKEGYAVNVDAGSHKAKFWRWQADQALQLIDEKEVKQADTYHLKVVCIDGNMQYWVNDTLVANIGDHTMQPGDLGQGTVKTEGYYGLLNWNSKVTFQNTKFENLDEKTTPAVTDVTVGSHDGTVDKKAQFFPESPTWIQYVKNDAKTVYLTADKADGSSVTFEMDGRTYQEGDDIPVAEGINWITMTVTNGQASRTYRLDIHKFGPDSQYYNEPYRGQYHYSVKEGWANDPNGLVKYNGKYHMFYQFYDDDKWGPMHWMHATSTDLVHWEEQPVTFYPDMNGTMFSGCIAVDETNSSKLFSTDKGGLIAYITVNGNGQRIKLAISEDEGNTWKKVDKIAADWSDDPLQSMDFRDPKVFQWENKWFMVVAGGPLRIYSSEDMVNWKVESTYSNLHTECPDLYPQEVDGQVKWILSRGGRYYKVGDLKEVNGKWTFVPDDYYKDKDGVMNFGRDSYAAMTYYVSSFGTEENPTIPEIVELNWMNTWDDYCNQVASTVNQKYNGTFNLHLKIGLIKDANGVYRLTQTPIDAYAGLRDEGTTYAATVGPDNDLLKDFQGTSYEIVSRFMPAEGTKKVGFKVRTGSNGEETLVVYDLEKDAITLDRSKSGIQISGKFSETNSQTLGDLKQTTKAARNADGSIDLHVFVDASSVEVFTNNYTVAGANQIFPLPTSQGASVVVEGAPCQADIQIYNLASTWTDKADAETSIQSTDTLNQTLYTGKSKKLNVYVMPVTAPQDILWSSDNEDIVTVSDKGQITGIKAGEATVTATMKSDPDKSISFQVAVKVDNFNTNIEDTITDGDWVIENDELINDNHGQNAYWLSKETYDGDYTVDTDVKYARGLVNIFFGSNSSPFDNGAYSVQLRDNANLRLFRFAKDGVDEDSVQLAAPLNDDAYHHITIAKEGKTVKVSVDGTEVLTHTYDNVDSHFDTAHIGLGLWDGKASFKNFIVTTPEQPAVVDKEALKEETAKADHMDKTGYTEESVAALDKAVQAAIAVLENPDADQAAVNKALADLNAAVKALKPKEETPKEADKTALNKAIEDASKVDPAPYTQESWDAFAAALKSAQAVAADDKADQTAVDKALADLETAKAGLRQMETPTQTDKTELNKVIAEAGKLNKAEYTTDSWKALETALAAAKEAAADDKADQTAVDAAVKALNEAVKNLKPAAADTAVNKDALNKAIAEAEKLNKAGYTADSWKAFEAALKDAKAVAADEKADQAKVDAAAKALEAAKKALVKAAANPGTSAGTKTPGKTPTAAVTGAAAFFTAAGASLAAMLGIRSAKRRKNR